MKSNFIFVSLLVILFGSTPIFTTSINSDDSNDIRLETQTYTPSFNAFNIKAQMKLTPLFTPDNAIDIYVDWISRANVSIELQNQYITQWDDSVSWANDPSPLVREIINANNRGIDIKVQVREDSDSDDVTSYFLNEGIEVRWMGNSLTSSDYLSSTHNKLILIDNKVTLISSINFGENAFTNNREAGMVVQNPSVTTHFKMIFDKDWLAGEVPIMTNNYRKNSPTINQIGETYPSHTNIPVRTFSGIYNVTAFTNPDNADKVIFDYLNSAKESIYISMYTISRSDFTDTLINLKKANPSIDIQVLISNRRVGGSENTDTKAAAEALVENLIPVYNSTKDDFSVDGFYHNKYWIIDGKHTFIYSGNWSPRSVTPQIPEGETYSSSEANRDMGIAIHDATDIADFVKSEVWDKDVAVGSAWELPIGISQTSFKESEVLKGSVTLTGVLNDINVNEISYSIDATSSTMVSTSGSSFSTNIDTTQLVNGIHTIEVTATLDVSTYTDSVKINIVNIPNNDNWRFLITEVLSNPEVVSDTLGEFFELTNSFPFDLLIGGWQAGDNSKLLTFPKGYQIAAFSSIIIAKNSDGFTSGYGKTAEFELSISLTNTADFVQMLDIDGNYIDVVSYGMDAPDGSEMLSAADSGQSIQRFPLHVDTNSISDFTYTTPDPLGNVPEVAFRIVSTSTAPLNHIIYLMSGTILTILILKRKKD